MTELSARTETNPNELSPAWRKMVAIASIVAMDATIVIFDESTTGDEFLALLRYGIPWGRFHTSPLL